MSQSYEWIRQELYSRRCDLMFSPQRLDQLTAQERLEVEQELMCQCISGNPTAFPYIPHMKTLDPEAYLPRIQWVNATPYDWALLYRYYYERSRKEAYLQRICQLAQEDTRTFSMLLLIYRRLELDARQRRDLFRAIWELSEKADHQIRSKMLRRILPENATAEAYDRHLAGLCDTP